MAKYPFLSGSKDFVKENDLTIEEILTEPLYERARMIGIERLDNAFKKRDVGDRSLATKPDCIMELLSYPIARMVAVCVDDTYFKRRYALGEAYHAYKNLVNESTYFLLRVAKEFNLQVKQDKNTHSLSIHFTDYLHYAPTRYKEWKMVNREMRNGCVKITHKDLARLIQEALRARINLELDDKACHEAIFGIFNSEIKRIQNQVTMRRKKLETVPIGELDVMKLPPCMKDLLSAIQSGSNVPHMGRFALVAFLNSLKLTPNEILKVFSSAPDFEEEKTRYQVEHITGSAFATTYTPPGCDKMRTYGICPMDKIDMLCKKKKHPLSYYRAKWKEYQDKKGPQK